MIITDSIKPPKISVIVPVYNTETYLRQCIGSLLSQTLEDIEVICVNDGSTDKSLAIIEEYMKKDDRVKLITQENCGIAAARNKGRYLARGEYIAFMNSDDYAKPDMFQKLYESAKEYDTDITMCAVTTLDASSMSFSDVEAYYTLELFNEEYNDRAIRPDETYDFMFRLCVSPWNKIYRREFMEKKHITFTKGVRFEERLFYMESYLSAAAISIVKSPLLVHRIKDNKKDSHKLDLFKIMKLEKDFLTRKKLYKDLKYQFEKSKRNTLVYYYKTIKNPFVKLTYRFKFFMLYPFQKPERI